MSRIKLQGTQPKQRCGRGREDHPTCHHPVQALFEVRNAKSTHIFFSERHRGPLGRALQSEGAGYAGAENPNLVMPDLGTVPNEAWPRLGEKNYPDPRALEVGNAAQALASLLRVQTAKGEKGASSLERSSLRYNVVVIVRAHHGGALIG